MIDKKAHNWLPEDLQNAINEANNHDGPVVVDFVIEKVDYVYPMIPAGGSVDQLIEEETS